MLDSLYNIQGANSGGLGARLRYMGYFASFLHPPGRENLVIIFSQRHVLGVLLSFSVLKLFFFLWGATELKI